MELFIMPMSCSFAAHVACLEAGIAPTLRHVARATKQLEGGGDYLAIAPQGNVPALRTEDGWILTESSAVLQYIADHATAPGARLAPRPDARERYELAQWLNFVSSEVHKKHVWTMFSSKSTPEQKEWAKASAGPMLAHVERHLATRDYLMGSQFTVADCYLFWALLVVPHGGLALDAYPAITEYVRRIQARPTVAKVLAYEVPMFQRERAQRAA